MIGTHHHDRNYVAALESERRGAARAHDDGRDLEYLVRAAASGEQEAWGSLMQRFTRRLARVARAHRVGSAAVDDIVQTTFVRLFEQIDTLRDPKALPAWLETTARRESLRHLRLAARERPLDAGIVENLPALPQPERASIDAELRRELDAAVDRLSDRQRSLVGMLFSEESASYDEIATTLGIPIGSIGPTRGRALARLREDSSLTALATEHLQSDEEDASTPARYARSWASTAS